MKIGTNIDGKHTFNFGNGNNKLIVGGYYTGHNELTFGNGDDVMTVASNINGGRRINFGEIDTNSLTVGGYLLVSTTAPLSVMAMIL